MEKTLKEINRLFSIYGQETYGEENCNKFEHATQSGTLAIEQGLDREIALAAFLHDIGHFIAQDQNDIEFTKYGLPSHDDLGADFLKENGFSERLVLLVREHVQVKRYLAATVDGYQNTLSYASQQTLIQQNGPMSKIELNNYKKKPYLNDIIKLRELDDSGKKPDMVVKPLSYWLDEIKYHLNKNSV